MPPSSSRHHRRCCSCSSPSASLVVARLVLVSWLVTTATVDFVVSAADPGKGHTWSYEGGNGPDHWCHAYQECCGSQQSPVNIDTNTVRLQHIPSIQFHHYDREPSSLRVRNNGHSVYVDLNQTGSMPMINDGGLGSNFIVVGFHFHWPGEHTIDGERAPLEMHVVHYNSRYGDLKTALKNRDGIAVVGILFEEGKKDNLALAELVKALPKIKYALENTTMETTGFSLVDFMPDSTLGFYRYFGSLTTPECQEIVTWTVFEAKNHVSKLQLEAFRHLKASRPGEDDVSMEGNYRPLQPLKGRHVYRRIIVSTSRAHLPCLSLIVLLVTFIITATLEYYSKF